jgi:hypothetical protein
VTSPKAGRPGAELKRERPGEIERGNILTPWKKKKKKKQVTLLNFGCSFKATPFLLSI